MRIAVIGTGISGLAAAWLLNRRHEVHVFEKRPRVGGHSHTVIVEHDGRRLALDTGFIVFNRVNYPYLTRLFDLLSVESQETDMSFAMRCERCDLEYNGRSLSSLFAQRANVVRPAFYRMLLDIVRFGALGRSQLALGGASGLSLREYLRRTPFGTEFAKHYLVPMAAALWSTGTGVIDQFPAESLLRFFDNHGLLRLRDRLRWRTVVGGSGTYVEAIRRDFGERLRTNTPVRAISRARAGVRLVFEDGSAEFFDRVVIATHADEALKLLCDPTPDEVELLSPWRYSGNDTWLHTDVSFLPRRRATWASWNYALPDCRTPGHEVSVSYYLNSLQRLDSGENFVVTLNPTRPPAAARVIRRMHYTHPLFTAESVATQPDLPRLNGPRNTYYAGAYFGYGFHEDGMRSAVQVADAFGIGLP
jgi:predicted NAD/FAD-binding protein